ncbi:hypothetical protein GCM10009069_09410 [Algimonas arctica]|uniref:Uncharacterized protein n=1 Tax=Algimonas arctica TaxID=1479486 RepID=A0A8J3G1R4_9PROT|nr:hypothetical protein GCM10009069_09410 [Algimonas arctica]
MDGRMRRPINLGSVKVADIDALLQWFRALGLRPFPSLEFQFYLTPQFLRIRSGTYDNTL